MSELAILQKIEDMMIYAYKALSQFPKAEKYTLGADIRQAMTELLKLVTRCNKLYTKKTTMQDLDIQLAVLKRLVSTAFKLQFMDFKKYSVWSVMLDEIGKMIGGWFKSIRHNHTPPA